MAYNFWNNNVSPVVPRSAIGGWRACWVTAALVTAAGMWSLHDRPAVWPADTDGAGPSPPVLETRINPNEADWPSLCRLPGIGPARANDIIAYREHYRQINGPEATPFTRPEDLDAVPGIGPKTVEQLRPWLVFTRVGGDEPGV
ncbi:MAG: helix-hairpin-helix domain-containing protein [Sedimentisphaerales bacterium]|nr:helix-hairpin-helix domain-containing protein [Sedimentisphaerales bacterium]